MIIIFQLKNTKELLREEKLLEMIFMIEWQTHQRYSKNSTKGKKRDLIIKSLLGWENKINCYQGNVLLLLFSCVSNLFFRKFLANIITLIFGCDLLSRNFKRLRKSIWKALLVIWSHILMPTEQGKVLSNRYNVTLLEILSLAFVFYS